MTMTFLEKLNYRYVCYANIIFFYVAITYFFQYAFNLWTLAFYLILTLLVSEGIIRNHKHEQEKLVSGKGIPFILYPLVILLSLVISDNIFHSNIYFMDFNVSEQQLQVTQGTVIREYEGNHYVKILDNQGHRKHFEFDYPNSAVKDREIAIPTGEKVTIKYLQTNSKMPSHDSYYLLAYDIRGSGNNSQIYLDGKNSAQYYSQFRVVAIRNMLVSVIGYFLVALINYIVVYNGLKQTDIDDDPL